MLAKKSTWQRVPLSGLVNIVTGMNPKKFLSGIEAIYLKPIVTDTAGKSYPWICLDIEAPGEHHKNIQVNIEAAKIFLAFLIDHGLTVDLIIFLSGFGFRFCWPYLIPAELQRAFKAWITSPDYPMIDPAPFTKKAFYRVFANRNHSNQGAVLDRHIHRLKNINDIWFMTEPDYMALVNRTIEIKIIKPWMQEIIPTGFIPEQWTAFLSGFKTRAALADTIYSPIMPVRKHRKPIAFIAEQAGIEFRQCQFHNGEILQLKTCPVCGRSDGRPYVTESGRLKCHHRNTCEAGQSDEQGNIVGLPASSWLPGGLVDDFETDETPADDTERISLETARNALRDAFKSKGDTYITLSPGAGKTTTVILELMADESGKIAIATPEHKLNSELYELATSRAKFPERIHMLQGRNKTNCTQHDRVQEVSKAGYPAGILVCSRCTFKKDKSCPYLKQFETMKESSGLWLMTHHMSLEVDFKRFSLLVVDESPLKVFLQKQASENGCFDRIRSKISPTGRQVIDKTMAIIQAQLAELETSGANMYDLSRIYVGSPPPATPWAGQPGLFELAGISAAEVAELDQSLSSLYQWENEKYPQYLKRLYFQEHIDLTALKWLQSAIAGDAGLYVRFKRDKTHPAKFIHFEKRLPNHRGRLICLDATGGSMAETETLFERRFTHVQGRVEMPGLRTAHIKQATGKTVMNRKTYKQIGDMIRSAAEFLKPDDKKVLLITHMQNEETVKRLASEILEGREIHTCHFWGGSRGVNSFGECTAAISIGQPFPNIGGMFDHSMTLISDTADRIQWIANTGTAELVQALHRIRPVKGNRTLIHVGRDFPVAEFGQPNFKISRQRGNNIAEPVIDEILGRLSPAVDAIGIMTKAVSWMLGVCLKSDFDKMKQAHEMIVNNIESGKPEYLGILNFFKKVAKNQKVTRIHSKSAGLTYYDILIGKPRTFTMDNRYFLISDNHKTWDAALRLLSERYQLPEHFSKAEHKVRGIGYLDDVQAFYESLGARWNPEQWTGERKIKC